MRLSLAHSSRAAVSTSVLLKLYNSLFFSTPQFKYRSEGKEGGGHRGNATKHCLHFSGEVFYYGVDGWSNRPEWMLQVYCKISKAECDAKERSAMGNTAVKTIAAFF